MSKKKTKHYSGIGGQAVLEGIMMKNDEHYSVGVRKPDGTIEVDVDNYQGITHGSKLTKIPFVRGVINFIDSLVLGMRCLNFSATFYVEEDESAPTNTEAVSNNGETKPGNSDGITAFTGVIAVVFAVVIFMILPVILTNIVSKNIRNESLIAIIEGGIRLAIFLLYVVAISLMRDIRRVYMYHGAEHKCINCIERGRPLTVPNVMRSSRQHKRCGTSFLLFVVVVSIIVFFFIRVDNLALKVVIRLLLIPVIAGISYELLRLAGRYDNFLITILSAPGMLLQRLTTREPDEDMCEVAIAAVEAVFDWRQFLLDEFGYDYREVSDADLPEISDEELDAMAKTADFAEEVFAQASEAVEEDKN